MEVEFPDIGKPYDDHVKITAAGYPVMRNNEWLITNPIRLSKFDLLKMLKAMEGIGAGDFDGAPRRHD